MQVRHAFWILAVVLLAVSQSGDLAVYASRNRERLRGAGTLVGGGPRRAQTNAPNAPNAQPRPSGRAVLPPVVPVNAANAAAPSHSMLDEPTATVWPAVNRWTDRMEHEYSDFIARLGRGVDDHRCTKLDACLRDPAVNSLYDPATDAHLTLDVDCADLPYILRAYFAFKRRLPWGFVASVRGRSNGNHSTDPRYLLDVRPDGSRNWRQFATPRVMLREMVGMVHSGMYRTAADVETGDFYPPAVTRQGIVPGTTYYDPNGHVLVVTQVRSDGTVFMIDGHPDGTLTWKRFGEAFAIGTRRLGGGFKNFRPLTVAGNAVARAPNRALRLFDGASQWDEATWARGLAAANPAPAPGAPAARVTYQAWVRAALTEAGVTHDPVHDFREQVQALCRDVADRADAVELALQAGIQRQAHPAELPWNIYGTEGDWETFSTPSRDARLKASFRELRETVAALGPTSPLLPVLRAAWTEETARPECHYAYTNSAGARVPISFTGVLDRLWAMSFDPYHCPELRWGAARGSPEFAACPDDPTKLGWYASEQRLRNQIDRQYGVATPLTDGPETAPDVDVRRVLGLATATPLR